MKQVKLRALNQGHKLKDTVADLLRRGLAAAQAQPALPAPSVKKDRKTGLPVIACRQTPASEDQMTPQRVSRILLEQEAEWADDAGR